MHPLRRLRKMRFILTRPPPLDLRTRRNRQSTSPQNGTRKNYRTSLEDKRRKATENEAPVSPKVVENMTLSLKFRASWDNSGMVKTRSCHRDWSWLNNFLVISLPVSLVWIIKNRAMLVPMVPFLLGQRPLPQRSSLHQLLGLRIYTMKPC